MKYVQEIVQIATKLRREKIEFFTTERGGSKKNKFTQLYEGISSGAIKDDRSACKYLYGEEYRSKLKAYRKLRERFFWRVVNTLFFLDVEKASATTFNQAQYECRKLSISAQILVSRGARTAAAYLAQRGLGIALKHDFSTEAVECANIIAGKHGLSGNTKGYEKYASIALEWMQKRDADEKAELYYMRIMSWYAANWSLQQQNLIEISNYIHQIDGWRKRYNTNNLHLYYFRLSLSYAEVEQDYKKIIQVANEIREYFKLNTHFASKPTLAGFIIAAMSAHIWRREFVQAFNLAKECRELLALGSPNWFTFQEHHIILALRSAKYELAQSIFKEVINNPRFNRNNTVLVEKWRLMEFYVRFTCKEEMSETLMPRDIRGKDKHFRAFASTLTTLSKDLTGFNVVAVFAHILYLLRIGDFDSLIQRDESLQTLRRKRLSKLNYRLAIFARMIHLIVENNFDHEDTRRRAQSWLKKLSNVPQKYAGGAAETLEVIPLEDLWEMMMQELEKNA